MWRQIQKNNFRSLTQLADFLEIPFEALNTSPHFPLNLPRRLAEKMEKGKLADPLLRQFVPLKEEGEKTPGFTLDPVEDSRFCKTPKLLQKYQGRALLLSTSACAMHCRYCFRQNFEYAKKDPFESELDELRQNPEIHEVILSGGDPLSLADRDLESLLTNLEAIPHLKIIRFHTRFPIGIPERITPAFCALLEKAKKQIIFVLHANHPKELDEDVLGALKQIPHPLLLQSVLLKGVNDHFETLKSLYEKAISHGIIPYYLHQLDPVSGAAHFAVESSIGVNLIEKLRSNLPGYAVPRFVAEVPGALHKTPLDS